MTHKLDLFNSTIEQICWLLVEWLGLFYSMTTMDEQIKIILERRVDEVIDREQLEGRLKNGDKLRVKLGIDPTSPNIHLGRAVPLWKLREFQDLGHQVVFIVGDFTGLIGDTSDKESERPMLSEEEVEKNKQTYFEQAFKILDKNKTEIKYNAEWLRPLGYLDICKQADLFGLHEFSSRELIKRRLEAGKRVSLRELLYPLMQGYDSVAVRADVEVGGTDQRFNLLAGRTIQPMYGQKPQNIVICKFPLLGTDGRKMSSSWGNVINITEEPNEMFGKVMSIPDNLMPQYFELATRLPEKEIQEILKDSSPRDAKARLAREIVELYHGPAPSAAAVEQFDTVFSQGQIPENMPVFTGADSELIDFLTKHNLADSRSEAKRLIEQKGVKINGETASSWETKLKAGDVIKLGSHRFVRVN